MKQVYLDGAANAPIDKRVIKAMRPYLKPGFCGNSRSAHRYGAVADRAVYSARLCISKCLGVGEDEVLFTSGATESNNWAIKALAMAELAKPAKERRTRIVCTATEHASVLAACDSLTPLGFEVVRVAPSINGGVASADMRKAIKGGPTLLVCCMAINNETGAYNPVDVIAKFAHDAGALCLCDVTQAMSLGGRTIDFGANYPNVDMLSFSAHKIYGPTGVGCLIKRRGVELPPLLSGGAQEFGLRGGTDNVAGIVGMAEAVRLLAEDDGLEDAYTNILGLFYRECGKALGHEPHMTAYPVHRNIVSLRLDDDLDYPGPSVADAFAAKGIAVSAGAACSNGPEGQELSHVLSSMGMDERSIRHTVRVSFTKFTRKGDIKAFAKALSELMALYPKGRKD